MQTRRRRTGETVTFEVARVMTAEAYCHTCDRSFGMAGIASHVGAHRRRGESCGVSYPDGAGGSFAVEHDFSKPGYRVPVMPFNCHCLTCDTPLRHGGTDTHRNAHRARREDCEIRFADGSVKAFRYSVDRDCAGLVCQPPLSARVAMIG